MDSIARSNRFTQANITIMNSFTWRNGTSCNEFTWSNITITNGWARRAELVRKNIKKDLRTYFAMGLSGLQTELWKDILQDNMGKSSCFKLEPVWQAERFQKIDTLLSILALRLMELYIDTTNLAFPYLKRCSLSA